MPGKCRYPERHHANGKCRSPTCVPELHAAWLGNTFAVTHGPDEPSRTTLWPASAGVWGFFAACIVLAVASGFYAAGNIGDAFHRELAAILCGLLSLLVLLLGWVLIKARRLSRGA